MALKRASLTEEDVAGRIESRAAARKVRPDAQVALSVHVLTFALARWQAHNPLSTPFVVRVATALGRTGLRVGTVVSQLQPCAAPTSCSACELRARDFKQADSTKGRHLQSRNLYS